MNLLRVPPPEVVQQEGSTLSVVCQAASTDRSLEIQWYQITTKGVKLPVNSQRLPFKTKSAMVLKANIITVVTSTLTIERLSGVYVGAYACRAVAGDIKVDSDAFQVQVSGMAAITGESAVCCSAHPATALMWYHMSLYSIILWYLLYMYPHFTRRHHHGEQHLASHWGMHAPLHYQFWCWLWGTILQQDRD